MSEIPQIVATGIEIVDIGEVQAHPENPRRGAVGLISESLLEHGQYRPLVVQRSSGNVIAGSHTLQAALALGMEQIAVTYVDLDDQNALRVMLIDNRSSDMGIYDTESLAALLGRSQESFGNLLGTGYDSAMLVDLSELIKKSEKNATVDAGSLKPIANPELESLKEKKVLVGMTESQFFWWQENVGAGLQVTGITQIGTLIVALLADLLELERP